MEMSNLPSCIFKRWVRSREEDSEGRVVYRPFDYPLPPARGRESIEFRENGNFTQYLIGSTDRSHVIVGEWKLIGPKTINLSFSDPQTTSYSIDVVAYNEQILVLERK